MKGITMNDVKFDPTKPVMTRDGSKARIVCTDLVSNPYPVAARITNSDGKELIVGYTREGFYYATREESDHDLINIPEEREVEFWVNVYPSEVGYTAFATKESANSGAGYKRIACLHIKRTYKVGEGLENK